MNEYLSPRAKEQQKTLKQKSDDWSYTLSHMATCLATDFTPFISSFIQHGLTGNANLGSHLIGEFAGDALAVPATIAVQRFSPELTSAVRHMVEPMMRPFYEYSATQATEFWAHEHHISEDSPEFYAYRQQQYNYEMDRIPLQLIWTAMSVGLNVAIQKTVLPNEESLKDIAISTGGGALMTLGLQTLGRVFVPGAMHAVDNAASDYIVTPITKLFGGGDAYGEGKLVERQLAIT